MGDNFDMMQGKQYLFCFDLAPSSRSAPLL